MDRQERSANVNTASVDRTPWVISNNEDRPPALEIALLKQTVVLSWNQFVYAEGSDDEIRIAFASHDVVVRGAGLSSLLQAVSANKVSCFVNLRGQTTLGQVGGLRFVRLK